YSKIQTTEQPSYCWEKHAKHQECHSNPGSTGYPGPVILHHAPDAGHSDYSTHQEPHTTGQVSPNSDFGFCAAGFFHGVHAKKAATRTVTNLPPQPRQRTGAL